MAACRDCGQQLSRFKKNGGHMSTCPQVTGVTRPGGKATKDEKKVEHSHAWSNWHAWSCLKDVNGTDYRYRNCLDKKCSSVDSQSRKCRH